SEPDDGQFGIGIVGPQNASANFAAGETNDASPDWPDTLADLARASAVLIREAFVSGSAGSLANYAVDLTGRDPDNAPVHTTGDVTGDGAGVIVGAGRDITCTITTTRKGATVVITKLAEDYGGNPIPTANEHFAFETSRG